MIHIPAFDSATHTYTTPEGRPLVGVTSALASAGLVNTQWFTEEACWRGSVVHKCCELWNRGVLKESTVDPAALGYLDSWREWCHRMNFTPLHVEQPRYHPLHLYAGTEDTDDEDTDVDYKTGSFSSWHQIQLALYSNFHANARARRRFVVRLQANGRPMTTDCTKDYPTHLSAGLSAINLVHWKERYGN